MPAIYYMKGHINEETTNENLIITRKHSSGMHTDRAITRMSSDRVAMRPIVDRMTHACENITFLSVITGCNFSEVLGVVLYTWLSSSIN